MRQARALARGLCSANLRADELIVRLKTLAVDTQRTFHMTCHFDPPQESGLVQDDAVATNLYCIAREAITNAVKHGKARNVQLRLSPRDGSLMLAIQDDGVGFQRTDDSDGIGLRIMSHRASLLGGRLLIESPPGAGTTVTCTIPAGRAE
jgi:signal transduction histidine kinase